MELAAVRRAADIAEAAYAARLRVFNARAVGETREVLTTKQWVRHHLHVSPGETGRTLKIAKTLDKLPVVAAALADGSIRMPHAAAIADACSLLGVEVIAGCQEALVEAASVNEPGQLRAALRGLGAAVDKRNEIRNAEKKHQGRWLDIATTFDGAVSIQGMLDAENGAIVQAAIDAAAKPAGAHDDRTAAQRRADALIDVCRGTDSATDRAGQGQADDVPRAMPGDGEAVVGNGDAMPGAIAGQGCRCGTNRSRPSLVIVCDLATLEARAGGYGEIGRAHV